MVFESELFFDFFVVVCDCLLCLLFFFVVFVDFTKSSLGRINIF